MNVIIIAIIVLTVLALGLLLCCLVTASEADRQIEDQEQLEFIEAWKKEHPEHAAKTALR